MPKGSKEVTTATKFAAFDYENIVRLEFSKPMGSTEGCPYCGYGGAFESKYLGNKFYYIQHKSIPMFAAIHERRWARYDEGLWSLPYRYLSHIGMRLQIALDTMPTNIAQGWNIAKEILMRYGVQDIRVVKPKAELTYSDANSQISIQPDTENLRRGREPKEWEDIFNEIEMEFIDAGIRPKPKSPEAEDKDFEGSYFFTYHSFYQPTSERERLSYLAPSASKLKYSDESLRSLIKKLYNILVKQHFCITRAEYFTLQSERWEIEESIECAVYRAKAVPCNPYENMRLVGKLYQGLSTIAQDPAMKLEDLSTLLDEIKKEFDLLGDRALIVVEHLKQCPEKREAIMRALEGYRDRISTEAVKAEKDAAQKSWGHSGDKAQQNLEFYRHLQFSLDELNGFLMLCNAAVSQRGVSISQIAAGIGGFTSSPVMGCGSETTASSTASTSQANGQTEDQTRHDRVEPSAPPAPDWTLSSGANNT